MTPTCESCGAPAEVVRTIDGSTWCEACDAAAVRLGYGKVAVDEMTEEEVTTESCRLGLAVVTIMERHSITNADADVIIGLVNEAMDTDPRIVGGVIVALAAWCSALLDGVPDETRAEALARVGLGLSLP